MKAKLPWLAGLLAAVIVASLLWLGHQNNQLREENAALAKAKAELEYNLAAERLAVKARAEEAARLNDETDRMRKELSDVYATDKDARAWADEPCPDPVLCRLRFQR